jgi:nicotinate phosphoribosyltransferase
LLIDTYNIEEGVNTAIAVAGTALGAVRIDSGDLPVVVSQVRAQLDALGATDTKIVVTNDLNEHTIAGLRGSPVDVFGVGTSVVTGSGAPAVGLVYKLVARTSDSGEWVSVAKKSAQKSNPGGRKTAFRALHAGTATEEVVVVGSSKASPTGARPLMVTLMDTGERVDRRSPMELTEAARAHHLGVITELPGAAFSLQSGEPIVPTRFLSQEV